MTDGHSGAQDAVNNELDDAGIIVDPGDEHTEPGTHQHQIAGAAQDLHDEAGPRKDEQQRAGVGQDPNGGTAGNDSYGTATKDSAASGSQDDGLQSKASDTKGKTSHEDSVMDSVMAALNLLPSWTLQNKISVSDRYEYDDLRAAVSGMLGEADTIVKCPFTTDELITLGIPIVQTRFTGQKNYKNRLKALVADEVWRDKFWSQDPDDLDPHKYHIGLNPVQETNGRISEWEILNEEYERWLDADDASIHTIRRHLPLFRRLALLNDNRYVTSAYELDFRSQDSACGALVTSSRSYINLRWMCELGDRFDIDPIFFVNHFTAADRRMVGVACFLNGVVAQSVQGDIQFVHGSSAYLGPVVSSTFGCISCTKLVDYFFIVLYRSPLEPSTDSISDKAVAIPLPDGHLANVVQYFFAEAWNAQRLAKLLSRSEGLLTSSQILGWLLALFAYETRIADLFLKFRKLDYELITMSSKDALDRIKICRAAVARLRASIATAKIYGGLVPSVVYPDQDAKDVQAKKPHATPRQLASTSMEAEYLWIDNEAAGLMPQLNANLQILIATISVEDAAVTKKNGERSKLLTAFAAIYLPLTLATGVFGMNIREIGPDGTPRWWAFVSLAAGLTTLSVFCIWLFFTRDVKIEHGWQRALHRITGAWYGNGLERKKSDEEKGGKLA